jgi:hypothetical protein
MSLIPSSSRHWSKYYIQKDNIVNKHLLTLSNVYGKIVLVLSKNVNYVVGVAQLVRVPDCGSGGRGFKSHHPPQFLWGVAKW